VRWATDIFQYLDDLSSFFVIEPELRVLLIEDASDEVRVAHVSCVRFV
jgi:hypothetical protein